METPCTTPIIHLTPHNLNVLVESAVEYLQQYYSRADRETYFFIAALSKQGKFVQQAFKVRELYENDARVREFVEKNIHNNLYYSINTFRTAKRIAREVAEVLSLPFDFDLHRPVTAEELEKILDVVRKFEEKTNIETTIIKSGGGVQVLIITDKTMQLEDFITDTDSVNSEEELFRVADANFKRLMNAFAERFEVKFSERNLDIEVDRAVFDFARVMRLPFSYNIKYDEPIEVELLQYKTVSTIEFVHAIRNYIKKLRLIQREEEKENVMLTELDDDKLKQVAIELSEKLAEFYQKGRRHFISLALSGFVRKYTNISEESAKKIIKTLAQLLHDEEINDRVKAVETTYRKKIEEVSALSILATVMSEEELKKFKNTVKSVFEKYAITKLNTFIYEEIERTMNTKKFVTMSNEGIKLVTVRYDEDKKYPAHSKLAAYAQIEINRIIRLHKNGDTTTLYDVTITDTETHNKIVLREKTVEEIAKKLKENSLAVVSLDRLTNYLTAILKRLEVVKKIEIEDVYEEFNVEYDKYSKKYIMTDARKLKNLIDKNIELENCNIEKVYDILANVSEYEKLFVLLSTTVYSAFTKTDNLLRPIVVIDGEKGTGKTTLARFFTTIAFLNNEGSNDTLQSEFRTIELLTQSYTPVLIDDAEMTRIEVQKLLKAYVTGSYLVKRGRSNLKIEEYELKNSIIITSNNFYIADDALKDRTIVLKVNSMTFKDRKTAFMTEDDDVHGWGYILLKKVIEYLNNNEITFKKLVRQELYELEEKIDYDKTNMNARRIQMYAQMFASIKILLDIIEHEKLHKRLEFIYENKEKIICWLEANQQTDEERMLLETILDIIANDDEVRKFTIIKFENDKEVMYVTASTLKIIQKKYNIRISLRKLAEMLNTKTTTVRDSNITKYAVKISENVPGYVMMRNT